MNIIDVLVFDRVRFVCIQGQYFTARVIDINNDFFSDAQQKIYKTVADIPGPRSLPVFGTRWIYWKFCLYKLNAVHLAYEGTF